MNDINIGDVVTLKSNKLIKMTVNKIKKQTFDCECIWFEDATLNRETFDLKTLELYTEKNYKEIKLSEDSIKLLNLQELSKSQIILVYVDIGNLPKHISIKIFEDYKIQFKKLFPNNQIVIIPKSTIVDIIEPA